MVPLWKKLELSFLSRIADSSLQTVFTTSLYVMAGDQFGSMSI
jgi:hypothetical protein